MDTRHAFRGSVILLAALTLAAIPSRIAAQESGGSFVIPAPPAQEMVVESDRSAGWLGVTISEVSADKAKESKLSKAQGVLVEQVDPNGPAAKAGLKAGDIITEFNGQRVEGTMGFRRMVRETPEGRTIQLTIWRDGRPQTLSAELAAMPRHSREDMSPAMPRVMPFPQAPEILRQFREHGLNPSTPTIGISAMDVSGQLGAYFNVPDGEGVLVTEVKENSPAAKGGLKAGDVITKINGTRVHDLGELRGQLGESRDTKSVTLSVVRKGAETSLTVEPELPKPLQPRYEPIRNRRA
jgi:serine protease Do